MKAGRPMGFIARENVVVGGRFWPKGATLPDDVAALVSPGSSVAGDQVVPGVEDEVGVDPEAPVGDGSDAPDPAGVPGVEGGEGSTAESGGEGGEGGEGDEPTGPEPVPTEFTKIVQIMEWVGTDPVRAATALQQEKGEDKPRTQLVDGLEEVIRAAAKAEED